MAIETIDRETHSENVIPEDDLAEIEAANRERIGFPNRLGAVVLDRQVENVREVQADQADIDEHEIHLAPLSPNFLRRVGRVLREHKAGRRPA